MGASPVSYHCPPWQQKASYRLLWPWLWEVPKHLGKDGSHLYASCMPGENRSVEDPVNISAIIQGRTEEPGRSAWTTHTGLFLVSSCLENSAEEFLNELFKEWVNQWRQRAQNVTGCSMTSTFFKTCGTNWSLDFEEVLSFGSTEIGCTGKANVM